MWCLQAPRCWTSRSLSNPNKQREGQIFASNRMVGASWVAAADQSRQATAQEPRRIQAMPGLWSLLCFLLSSSCGAPSVCVLSLESNV